ncbi:hypothetical protein D0469_13010 [Peribacillus saganii]|uniref:Uncharacterized protein n=1 Tax=Peribacillus saganii TaxID=2303992 RepID=A0A372LMQ0_9BACI|nr:hypothetical protein D0469_13010 [Peribacillus saganii]
MDLFYYVKKIALFLLRKKKLLGAGARDRHSTLVIHNSYLTISKTERAELPLDNSTGVQPLVSRFG